MSGRALFLDRDGTIVHPKHYPSRPEELILYDGIGPYLRALCAAGFRIVIVTNQAGIARGYFSASDLERMHDHLRTKLLQLEVPVDGIYYCPHHVDGTVPDLAIACKCRKPQPGMLIQAAADMNLDLNQSWFVGDILDDVEAGNRAGCRTILVDLGTESPPTHRLRQPNFVARNTVHALQIIQSLEIDHVQITDTHLPLSWFRGVPV